MTALPLVLAASLLIGVSLVIGERVTVVMAAVFLPLISSLATMCLWHWIGFHRYRSVRARQVNFFAILMSLAVIISVPVTHWPLRLAFRLSEPSFNQMSKSLQSGATYQQPLQVGLFTIKKAEIQHFNGKICLWTDLSPSGRTGFTRCPPNNVPFNLWSMIELSQDWQFISED